MEDASKMKIYLVLEILNFKKIKTIDKNGLIRIWSPANCVCLCSFLDDQTTVMRFMLRRTILSEVVCLETIS